MGKNATQIEVGQKWVTRCGDIVEIEGEEVHVGVRVFLTSKGHYVFEDGRVQSCEHPYDLIALEGQTPPDQAEYTGGSVNYYKIRIEHPTSEGVEPYTAECNDIIEALGMNYAEGNAFKAIWRMCAARLGKLKAGYKDGLYDAEKTAFFGNRMVVQQKNGGAK